MSTTSGYSASNEWVTRPGGAEIYSRTWTPSGSVKATLVFFHGIGEHINRYNHVFDKFAQSGIKVISFDQRGFGRTVRRYGQLGHNEGIKTVLEDGKFFSERVRQGLDASIPHFVMGHSMGGGLALRYAVTYPESIRGVVATAPLIETGSKTTPNVVEKLALATVPYLLPTFSLQNPVAIDDLSRDPVSNTAYRDDPYVHPWGTAQTYSDILNNAADLLSKSFSQFTMPVFVLHGTKDTITSAEGSRKFMDKIPSSDKTVKLFQDWYHELHNEPEKEQVIQSCIDWILARHTL